MKTLVRLVKIVGLVLGLGLGNLSADGLSASQAGQDGRVVEDESLKEIVVVSLGSHCQSSLILRELGVRWCAMPLDWLLSLDHKGLVRLIDDRFYHMFDKKYLIQYPEG